jgi:pyrrolidone-carboxylate peptidase
MIDVEQNRLSHAEQALAELLTPEQWHPHEIARAGAKDPTRLGEQLWLEQATAGQTDDRQLYWRRLALRRALKSAGCNNAQLTAFEHSSRGMSTFTFDNASNYRVAVTGFDPFHLNTTVNQSNPSGLVALQLNGTLLTIESSVVQIRTIVVPVRYADFDDNIIEHFFEPQLNDLDMIITVSMGRDGFDLERFPGRRRSVDTLDNEDQFGGGTQQTPVIPAGLAGPEFVEFSLPVEAMVNAAGQYSITDNKAITTLRDGVFDAHDLNELSGHTAVEGSGGGFLSNEISFRLVRLAQARQSNARVGHLHTPKLQGFDQATSDSIAKHTQAIIIAGIKALV